MFDECGVRFALEVHPSEIAYDYWTTQRTLEAIGHREAFGLNWDPSHMVWQDIDPVGFLWRLPRPDLPRRLQGHPDAPATAAPAGSARTCRGATRAAGWDFVSTGHGDVPWEDCFRMLDAIGYDGPISIEWEDAGMDRLAGAAEAVGFVRRPDRPARDLLRRRVQHRRLTAGCQNQARTSTGVVLTGRRISAGTTRR